MTADGKTLDVLLAEAGYSEEFVDYAMKQESSYCGDLRKFIDYVEHLLQNDTENQLRIATDASALMDAGAKRVEHDYTGDNLTHGGYDHIDGNRRW